MTQKETELIAHRALLPGVEHVAEIVLRALNETREALAMPALTLHGRSEEEMIAVAPLDLPPRIGLDGDHHAAQKRRMSASAKRKVGASVRERWNIVKQAGIDTKGRIPTNDDLERAKKILAKKRIAGSPA